MDHLYILYYVEFYVISFVDLFCVVKKKKKISPSYLVCCTLGFVCVCVLARAQDLFSPASVHDIKDWFRLREARAKHKKRYGGRILLSLPPCVAYYTLVGSSSEVAANDIGIRRSLHGIEGTSELCNPLD